MQVSEREAMETAKKAARQDAADRIYDRLRLEQEAALRAKVSDQAVCIIILAGSVAVRTAAISIEWVGGVCPL
jgi:hypothetical protein